MSLNTETSIPGHQVELTPAPITRTCPPRAPALAAHSPRNVCSGFAAGHLWEGTRSTQGGQQRVGEGPLLGVPPRGLA